MRNSTPKILYNSIIVLVNVIHTVYDFLLKYKLFCRVNYTCFNINYVPYLQHSNLNDSSHNPARNLRAL